MVTSHQRGKSPYAVRRWRYSYRKSHIEALASARRNGDASLARYRDIASFDLNAVYIYIPATRGVRQLSLALSRRGMSKRIEDHFPATAPSGPNRPDLLEIHTALADASRKSPTNRSSTSIQDGVSAVIDATGRQVASKSPYRQAGQPSEHALSGIATDAVGVRSGIRPLDTYSVVAAHSLPRRTTFYACAPLANFRPVQRAPSFFAIRLCADCAGPHGNAYPEVRRASSPPMRIASLEKRGVLWPITDSQLVSTAEFPRLELLQLCQRHRIF